MFDMQAGDIAVHAAGVSHRNVESSTDYRYMGLYPKVSVNLASMVAVVDARMKDGRGT